MVPVVAEVDERFREGQVAERTRELEPVAAAVDRSGPAEERVVEDERDERLDVAEAAQALVLLQRLARVPVVAAVQDVALVIHGRGAQLEPTERAERVTDGRLAGADEVAPEDLRERVAGVAVDLERHVGRAEVPVERHLRHGEAEVRARLQEAVPTEEAGIGDRAVQVGRGQDVVIAEHVGERDEAPAIEPVPVIAADVRAQRGPTDHVRRELHLVVVVLEGRGVGQGECGAVEQRDDRDRPGRVAARGGLVARPEAVAAPVQRAREAGPRRVRRAVRGPGLVPGRAAHAALRRGRRPRRGDHGRRRARDRKLRQRARVVDRVDVVAGILEVGEQQPAVARPG